jgi:hypothetical protein
LAHYPEIGGSNPATGLEKVKMAKMLKMLLATVVWELLPILHIYIYFTMPVQE